MGDTARSTLEDFQNGGWGREGCAGYQEGWAARTA